MAALPIFVFLSLGSVVYSQCMPSLHFFNTGTGVDFQSFDAATTVLIESLRSSFDVRAEFCSENIRSVVFTISGDSIRRINNNVPYTSGVVGPNLISKIRQNAIDSGTPQFMTAMAFDGFKGTGTMIESFQLTLDVKRRIAQSPSPSVSPTPSSTSIPSPSPSPFAPSSVSLLSPNATTFNAAAPLVFGVSGGTFDQTFENLNITVNDVPVPTELITLTPTLLTANSDLSIGQNNITLDVSIAESGEGLNLSTAVWIGVEDLTVNLVDMEGNPFLTQTRITATLADDLSVRSVINTNTGSVTFENLPPRTILIDVLSDNNDVGSAATLSSDGPISIIIAGFGEPSTVENNNFTFGLEGWEIPNPLTAIIVEHVEEVGPLADDPESSEPPELAEGIDLQPIAGRQLTNNDLQLTTTEEGSQQVIRTFRALFGTTGVRVRYRFVTSEIPGGFFGSMFNDFFSVSIRSLIEGGSIAESASMNGLGFAAFNPVTGSTDWREAELQLNSDFDIVEVRITVANVGDGAFDSLVIVDFVEELGCNAGEPLTSIFSIGPITSARARVLANEAFSVTEDTGLPGAATSGPGDGFRHCYWSCRMAQEFGVDTARDVGDLHELCGNNPEGMRLMDLFNNNVGRGFGTTGANCRNSCEQGVANGALQTSL